MTEFNRQDTFDRACARQASKDCWYWWAGKDEEWMQVGPGNTRDDVIHEAKVYYGEGEGDFVIMEAIMHEIHINAASILDHLYEEWADGDMFSMEHEAPEPQGSQEDQKAAEADLQALLDVWVAKWRHTLPTPNMFAATRNNETIRNAFDPDTAPGGHDNPPGVSKRLGDLEVTSKGLVQALRPENRGAQVSQGEGR